MLKDYYADKVEVINDFEEEQKADRFYLVDAKEDKRKDILTEFFKDKDGVLLTEQLKEEWTNELKELGVSNKKGEKNFTFDYIKKSCKELGICDFKRKVAGKKDCKDNSTLVYKKEYLQIKLLKNMDDSGG